MKFRWVNRIQKQINSSAKSRWLRELYLLSSFLLCPQREHQIAGNVTKTSPPPLCSIPMGKEPQILIKDWQSNEIRDITGNPQLQPILLKPQEVLYEDFLFYLFIGSL